MLSYLNIDWIQQLVKARVVHPALELVRYQYPGYIAKIPEVMHTGADLVEQRLRQDLLSIGVV